MSRNEILNALLDCREEWHMRGMSDEKRARVERIRQEQPAGLDRFKQVGDIGATVKR